MRSPARPLAVLLALASSAVAGQQFHSVPFGPVPAAGGSLVVQLPQFDPSAGVLQGADLTVDASIAGEWKLENTSAQAASVGGWWTPHYVGAAFTPQTPPGASMAHLNPGFVGDPTSLAPFDGVLDHAGPSGVTVPFAFANGGDNSETAHYSGSSAGALVGTGTFQVGIGPISQYGPNLLPPGVVSGSTVFVSGVVKVVYQFAPFPASICEGICPCGGVGAAGHGCPSSVNAQGAQLSVTGNASLSADTLVLAGSGMPDSPALYVQGDAFTHQQVLFGDGLRCIAGTLVRLGAQVNSGGSSSFPAAGDPAVSVRGGVAAPGTRYYQVFYRDPATFCTSSTFNATNGMAIAWGP